MNLRFCDGDRDLQVFDNLRLQAACYIYLPCQFLNSRVDFQVLDLSLVGVV